MFPSPMQPLDQPAAPVPDAPAEAPLTRSELMAMLAAFSQGGPAAAAAVPAPKVAKPVTNPSPGLFVTHTHEGPAGPVTQTGVVLEVLPAAEDGTVAVTVGWFAGVAGPVGTSELETL